jgi:hypothetical protein
VHACQRQATAVTTQQALQLRRFSGLSGLFFSFKLFFGTRNHFRGTAGYSAFGPGHCLPIDAERLPLPAVNPVYY